MNNRLICTSTRGFTLIECLVALVIIAIVLATTTRAIELSVNDTRSNYLRELAMWTADNALSDISIKGLYPDIGSSKDKVRMANFGFIVTKTVSSTPNPFFRKIFISVATVNQPDYSVFTTVRFIARY